MDVLEKLASFYACFEGEKGIIGYTEKKLPIYYFAVIKTPSPVIIAQYGIHAREHITTRLAMCQISDFINRGRQGSVYFIPAVNADGIKIACGDLPLYKANARGVDLNVNFDARWGRGEKNITRRGYENFIGRSAFSEAETRALRDFTLLVKPDATVSYHCKGEEIYWYFFQRGEHLLRDRHIADKLARATGYELGDAGVSAGGYKDWCVEKLHIPAFTIEVGSDTLSHPVGEEYLEDIRERNKEVITTLISALSEEEWKKNSCARR